MIIARTAMAAAFSTMVLAGPALAAPEDRQSPAVAPCDGDDPFDSAYDPVAFHTSHDYFADAEQDGEEADEADLGDDSADEDMDDGEDPDADGEGCATIMVAPYDVLIRAPDRSSMPIVLRRRVQPVRRSNRA